MVTSNKNIGNSLRMRRLEHRLSQSIVAQQAGISQQLLSSIENNERGFSEELIQRIENTIDVLIGEAGKNKVLQRIADMVSRTPFPSDNGCIFYWQAHVEDDGKLIFTHDGNTVELWESHFPEDEAAIREGITLFRFELQVRFKDMNVKRASFCSKYPPDSEELRRFFRERDGSQQNYMGIATPLLNHLAEFISLWYVTPGIKKFE
jgi:transcriptional regulator with XRE-family HTH domain